MVVKSLLPDRKPNPFCRCPFHLIDYRRYRRGGYWPPVRVGIDLQQQMNVVRHNHEFFNGYHRITLRNLADAPADCIATGCQRHILRAVDDSACIRPKKVLSMICTDGDKVSICCAVVILCQTISFAGRQFHKYHHVGGRPMAAPTLGGVLAGGQWPPLQSRFTAPSARWSRRCGGYSSLRRETYSNPGLRCRRRRWACRR